MMLEEAQARLKKEKINSIEQLWDINSLYILLDLDKDVFCRIVDVVGLDMLIKKKSHYDRLLKADIELEQKERFLRAKVRLSALEDEKENLEEIINSYQKWRENDEYRENF